MDDIKREELEKAYKKEKNYKIRIGVVTVRMVRVRNMSVEETADIPVCCPAWVRNRLRRCNKGFQDFPRCGRPKRILRNTFGGIITKMAP